MSTLFAIDPHTRDDDDYVVVDARRVILDLPDGAPPTDALPDRKLGAGGGHAAWLRGPLRPTSERPRESSE
jgi:hypothetical protein